MVCSEWHITQVDLDAIDSFSYVDISVGDVDRAYILRAPLFSETGPTYIVEVKLVLGERLSLHWTLDQSNMYSDFDAVSSRALNDGEYVLASNHYFVLNIEEGKPHRPDFRNADVRNKAQCCDDARAFLLHDPSTRRTSTYVQVNAFLIVEVSHNRSGCVHVWRRKYP